MVERYVTLWPWFLTRWVVDLDLKVRRTSSVTWSKSVRNLSEIEQSPAELWIIWRIFAHVMSCCDLVLGPLDPELLQHFGCHAFKLCKKIWAISNNPPLSYRRFNTFSPCNFRSGARLTNGSQGCVDPTSPNLARTYGDHSYTRILFHCSDIFLHF